MSWQHEGEFELHIHTNSGKRIPVWVEPSDTIGHVKTLIQAQTQYPVQEQVIVVSRIGEVTDDRQICHLTLFEGTTFFVFLRFARATPPASSSTTSSHVHATAAGQ